jgi:hypothetical protein
MIMHTARTWRIVTEHDLIIDRFALPAPLGGLTTVNLERLACQQGLPGEHNVNALDESASFSSIWREISS